MLEEFDIPIFKKTYELYKNFYGLRSSVPRLDRYAIWQRCENAILDVLENILLASQLSKTEKLPILERGSLKLNFLRVFLRLCKEIKILNNEKYILFEEDVDEIGRMFGGWIKSTKDR